MENGRKGNEDPFELARVRVIESRPQLMYLVGVQNTLSVFSLLFQRDVQTSTGQFLAQPAPRSVLTN